MFSFFNFSTNIYLFIPEIFIGFCLIVLFLVLIYDRLVSKVIDQTTGQIISKSLVINNSLLYLIFFSLFYLFYLYVNMDACNYEGDSFTVSPLLLFSKKLYVIITVFSLILFIKYNQIIVGITLEFFFAFFFVFFSSLLLLQSNNLIVFYILIEIQSIVLYFLIAFDRASSISAESGLKYFLTSIFMSIIFLLGISFIYITFGTTNLSLLSLMLYRLVDIGLSLYGFIFIFIFIFFKLAVVPFHFWALEVYEGASWPVISILAVISKLPLIIFLIKFFVVVSFDINLNVNLLLILINIFGIFSIIVGTFGAVYYMNIRKILVYSGITNIGYVLLALGASSLLSIIFVYIYFIFYMFVVLLLVSFILLIFGVKFKDYTFQFKGLAIKYSYIALLFLLLFFILVGLPPFAGFWTKFLLIYSMLITGSLFKALFVFISNILSAVYYLRIVKEMYFGKDNLVIISLNFKHYLDTFYLFLFIFILFFLCLIMLNFDLFIWIILDLFI